MTRGASAVATQVQVCGHADRRRPWRLFPNLAQLRERRRELVQTPLSRGDARGNRGAVLLSPRRRPTAAHRRQRRRGTSMMFNGFDAVFYQMEIRITSERKILKRAARPRGREESAPDFACRSSRCRQRRHRSATVCHRFPCAGTARWRRAHRVRRGMAAKAATIVLQEEAMEFCGDTILIYASTARLFDLGLRRPKPEFAN
mmetsp:Transcript_34859/g.96191  ORF Transcript_34859/g.96191 Transcript_34859/m.96191 type:complete len:202 (+) Transcript_34859:2624-3229(+)